MSKFSFLGSGLLLAALPTLAGPPAKMVTPPTPANVEFVANLRQWEKPVLFAADVPSGRLFLERGRLVQALYDGKQLDELHHHTAAPASGQMIRAHAYRVDFVGASPSAEVRGEEVMAGFNNYFIGSDPKRWASNVPGFRAVRYHGLFPGTDLRFYSKSQHLEYDFEVAAGANADRIRMRYTGQDGLRVSKGALHILTSVGNVVEQRPFAYQLVGGKRQPVPCEYVLDHDRTVHFALPQGYNHRLPLVIDPVLVYSSYSGSVASNYGYTASYDSTGNMYSGGTVFSTGFPTTVGAYSVSFAGSQDIGIIKYNTAATTRASSRLYATYVGGSSDDHPHSLVVGPDNALVILGSTNSSNYPTTTGAFDQTMNSTDIVLSKLNPTGSILVGSTFVGGSAADGQVSGALSHNYGDSYRGDVTTDPSGNIYVASITQSTNFPIRNGYSLGSYGGTSDAVVFKMNPALTTMIWGNYLGGSGVDAAYSVALDSVNNVFVSGGTASTNFAGTLGGYHQSYMGGTADGFISRISKRGDDLVQSTYIGTNSYDQAYFVQLNHAGEVFTYGQTDGTFPITTGLYGNPNSKQFIQKLNPMLTRSIYSTVIGNGTRGQISPSAFLVDDCGRIVIAGWGGDNTGFPVTPDAIRSTGGTGSFGYFYIAQLSANARQLAYATFFGGGSSHVDGGTSRFDKRGIIYQATCTGSGSSFPTTPNAWASTSGSSWNNTAFKIDILNLSAQFVPSNVASSLNPVRRQCVPARFYFNRPANVGTGVRWNFGNGLTSTVTNAATTMYTVPGKYVVRLTVYDSLVCTSGTTLVDTVRVYGLPRAAAGPDQTVCSGIATTLTVASAGAGITYTWRPATGLNTTAGRTVTATPTTTTTYYVRVNLPSGVNCGAEDTIVVNVRAPLVIPALAARFICPGDSTTLTVPDFGPGSRYTWTPALGLSSSTAKSVVAKPLVSTLYSVHAEDVNGCVTDATVQVNTAPLPVLAAVVSSPNLINKPVTFTNSSTGASRYRWDFGDGSSSTDTNPLHTYTSASKVPFQAKLTAFYGQNDLCELAIPLPVVVRSFDLPNVITPNGDGLNETFRPFVSVEKVNLQIFNRWGHKVFEQENYTDGWGSGNDVAAGVYYYRIVSSSGESWKGWLEVVK